jgi:hypothetical protein
MMTTDVHESRSDERWSPDQSAGSKWSSSSRSHGQSGGGIQEQLSLLADDAKAQATEALQPMKEKALDVASNQKNILADRIGGFARAMDGAAQQFAKEAPAAGDMLRGAAGSISNMSRTLRNKQIAELTGALDHFARNQPVALFAGAVVAGFALSRFLKSSSPNGAPPARAMTEFGHDRS